VTKGADPIAPGGEHNSQDGVGLDPAGTDDAEGELPAETPVAPEAPAPAEEAPLPPEPPAGKAPGLAAGVAAELVAANAEVIEGKLTPPYWPVRAVPAACGVAAVCAPAGLDTTTASGKRMRAVMFCITELRSLVITMSMTRSRRPEAPAALQAICGVRRIHPRPRAVAAANGEHANAVGAAIAQVNGEAEQVYHDLDPRRRSLPPRCEPACAGAAGVDRKIPKPLMSTTCRSPYVPENALRVPVGVTGEMPASTPH
jgi:hypothetical protein